MLLCELYSSSYLCDYNIGPGARYIASVAYEGKSTSNYTRGGDEAEFDFNTVK